MPSIQSQIKHRDGLLSPPLLSPLLSPSLSSPPPPSPPSPGSRISPVVLFVIIILAVLFFISGLLHLLVRFLLKNRSSSTIPQSNQYPEMSGSGSFQRQLQQLFNLHDSGLDQAFIDALPVFLYREIVGLKEPFDCAVCLCEFSEEDSLRLLPLCGHAFHIHCIDTWLLSNSTCPLCRGTLFTPGFSFENPVFDFDFDDSRDLESEFFGLTNGGDEIVREKKVFPVRLGKFRNTNESSGGGEWREGETSSSNLDARRCYSMGSFQYVVGGSNLQVALCNNRGCGNGGIVKGRGGQNGNSTVVGDTEGKKISIGNKGESFSVSKIWQWSKKGKLHSALDTPMVSSSLNVNLPWSDHRTQAT
ncbi:RING-H2 finger protein ATL46-like [Actinidia eriantha]|uniref:RING-H2 finger protein ATL46-like n=1 Tax=Actinidia eriantha TaxID=165200 RepID=UPI00258AA3F0|nr:RING-H2 finger protein ATL46-like [Actinidia eriantha]XP_057493700.1 RING-H2 finger protein ATL46-like [Actinidia eriantha]